MNNILKIILNIAIFLLIAGFVWYMANAMKKKPETNADVQQPVETQSDFKQVASYELPQEINRFELHDGKLYISSGDSIFILDTAQAQRFSFPVKPDVRDITAGGGKIYVLYPAYIEVYSTGGELLNKWEACSELSDYCSIALAGAFVFVTDAENKNIHKYTDDGNFVGFIKSPAGFIIPSYSFDIESLNDTIYCVNSGRHSIEIYSADGKFISSFGGAGEEAGSFAGCCNPVYISFTPKGELITSEKGNPRVSLFEHSGKFKEILLDNSVLESGNKACETRIAGNQLFVAQNNKILIFNYDKTSASKTGCSDCGVDCPLQKK